MTETLAQHGASVHLLFAFEYVILASAVISTGLKYVLSTADNALGGRWEGKVREHLGWGRDSFVILRV